ncbi:MAG: DUF5615 family PIN-like protein [Promethearchaeota archaeon]
MKLIVDECISESTIRLLKGLNFEVIHSKVVVGKSADDEDIYAYAYENQVPLLTHDRRFGSIYKDSLKTPATIIIIRQVIPHPKTANELLKNALSKIDLQKEGRKGKLILIAPASIRIRDKMNFIKKNE